MCQPQARLRQLRSSGFRGRWAVGHVRPHVGRTLAASLGAAPVTKLATMSVLNQVRKAKSGPIHRSNHELRTDQSR